MLRLKSYSMLFLCCVLSVGSIAMMQPNTPTPSAVCNVRDFGATGDGTTKDTAAIRAAIQACAANGGGTVLFPPGQYVTGTFELVSNITLNLEPGAVIMGSDDVRDYASTAAFGLGKTYGVDSSGEGDRVGLIVATGAQNVAITGRGAIDGRGDTFMDLNEPHFGPDFDAKYARNPEGITAAVRNVGYGPVEPKDHGAGRPGTMILFRNCRNVLIRDITLKNAPNWTLHLQSTEQAVITGIHIQNNPLIPNNDGIDCFACKHVHVSDSDIQTGDDDFAIVGSEHVTVTNCSLTSRSAAIRLESTRFSTFENLTIDSNRGIGVFHRGDSGESTDSVLFSGITMRTRLIPGHWWGKAEPIYIAVRPCASGTCKGGVKNVTFTNITAESESGALIYGAEGSPISGLTLDGVRLLIKSPEKTFAEQIGGNFDLRWTASNLSEAIFKHDIPGVYCRWIEGLRIRDLQVRWGDSLPAYFSDGIQCENFRDLIVESFEGRQAQPSTGAAISLSDGSGVSITGSTAADGTSVFLRLTNVADRRVFANYGVNGAKQVIEPAGLKFNTDIAIPGSGQRSAVGVR